jgi:nucleoside-diphosphate-sugar epimerase
MLPHGRLATEADSPDMTSPFGALRGASDVAALALSSQGVRASIIRLPPTVHGENDKGFVTMLINAAREKGFSTYVGEGQNRWPAVHRLDAAKVYRLALEKGVAGSSFHAVADEAVPFKDIADFIGKELNVPVVSKSFEEAQGIVGFIAHPISMDNPTSSKQTRESLGWSPTEPDLIPDLEQGHYFKK